MNKHRIPPKDLARKMYGVPNDAVSWDRTATSWKATGRKNGKRVHIGFFYKQQEALDAYLEHKAKAE